LLSRLELLRGEVIRLIYSNCPNESHYFIPHLYGVSSFCVLLAKRRGLDAELAAACGLLHDIYQVTHGTISNHAVNGAVIADEILRAIGYYSEEEIRVITTAVSKHSKKRKFHEPYDELLKDADVLDHSLHNPNHPIIDKEKLRYENLMIELGCSRD